MDREENISGHVVAVGGGAQASVRVLQFDMGSMQVIRPGQAFKLALAVSTGFAIPVAVVGILLAAFT